MTEDLKAQVRTIMASAFGTEVENITEETSPTTLDLWDSLKHMNLVVALEEEFEVTFNEEELIDMMSLDQILSILSDKIE
ncbi:MAG: acyl carrier protein [Verrucomicrobiota bacterium]